MRNEFRYLSDQRPISLLVINANVELSFLDINLHISDDKIQTSVYYKETDTLSILNTTYMCYPLQPVSPPALPAPTVMTSFLRYYIYYIGRCLHSSHYVVILVLPL